MDYPFRDFCFNVLKNSPPKVVTPFQIWLQLQYLDLKNNVGDMVRDLESSAIYSY